MISRKEEFNASINLMMSAKMRNFHYIKYSGLHQLLNPRMGDYVRVFPSCLHQVSMTGKHGVALSVSKVKVIVLQGWDLSQLASNYAYPLRYVHGDKSVLLVPWDVVTVNRANQRWDIIR
jgi:hypothetical protein